ncbi:hypothetical protein KA005_47285, partial [bacterium]|nr:hypothetical protein [bacterium]
EATYFRSNKIVTMMAMRLFAFDLIACLEKDAGREFENLTVESIFQLDSDAFINDEENMIVLEMNLKEPELMDKLNKSLCILNAMNIDDPDIGIAETHVKGDYTHAVW